METALPIVLRDLVILTQDGGRRIVRGDVRVEGGRFASVGGRARSEGAEVVDGHGLLMVPGFVNAHTHVAMTSLRGIADDVDLSGFLSTLFAVDARRTDADVEAGASVGIAEMLLSGTTSFLDLYYSEDAVARAVERLGIRGFLGWAVVDPDKTTQSGRPIDNARRFLGRWSRHDRVTPLVAPQGVYACNEQTWRAARELADETGSLLHFHLSETRSEVHEHEARTGERPPIWLDRIGVLGPRTVAAHAVWLTLREIDLLASRSVGIAHCPSSNLKLATGGVAPIVALRERGAPVGLGTDSAASNNSLSMLREMHVAGLLQKHQRWDAAALTSQQLLDLATLGGAALLDRPADLGSVEVGKWADFSLVRLDHPTMFPPRRDALVSHLAYSASEEAIDSVYVAGECVVRHRRLVRAEWPELAGSALATVPKLWDRAGPGGGPPS